MPIPPPIRLHARTAAAFAAAVVASTLLAHAPHEPMADDHVPDVPILMYHHVGDWGPARPDWEQWVVKPADFRAQMDWLSAHGYETITFRRLLDAVDGRARLPHRPVVVTFDDGWAAQQAVAQDELSPRGMRAVFFVYTGAVGPQPGGPYLSWPQLRALEAAGHEVQSHTVGHPRLTQLPPDRLAAELHDSKARIAAELHHPADVLAYPYGDHDDDVMDATLAAGYRLAVRADDDPAIGEPLRFRLPRVRMGYGEGIDVFAARMQAATPGDVGPAAGHAAPGERHPR